MRAVLQRVSSASVTVNNDVISQISRGLMVLVGIGIDDTTYDVDLLSNKILSLRVFDDAAGSMWKSSVKDIAGEVLCVSQFTLMANTTKGNKPDFHRAMGSEASRDLYAQFLVKMGELYNPDKIKDGRFGAMMNVGLTNEGPITFTLDSRKFEYVDQPVRRSGSSGVVSSHPNAKKTSRAGKESGVQEQSAASGQSSATT
ncbi:hypothetical protein PLICRDRAFT_41319 [Plicaturopsis crispa FD-325 SS-3]|nr:hypothetical protein PLICRDRAFT_41319 [Plicaturopsis crispa FD-325 SS-3]